jgi:hypothetical protein
LPIKREAASSWGLRRDTGLQLLTAAGTRSIDATVFYSQNRAEINHGTAARAFDLARKPSLVLRRQNFFQGGIFQWRNQ